MTTCPESSTFINCGLTAAQTLIDRDHIVIPPCFGGIPSDTIKIQKDSARVMEVLASRRVYGDGHIDTADFGCIACGKCIRIEDDFGKLTARIVD